MSVDRLAEAPPLLVFMARWHRAVMVGCALVAVALLVAFISAGVTSWGAYSVPLFAAACGLGTWLAWKSGGKERRRYEALRRGEPMPPSANTMFSVKGSVIVNGATALAMVVAIVSDRLGPNPSLSLLAMFTVLGVMTGANAVGPLLPNSRTRADEDERQRRAQLPPPPAMTLQPPASGR